MKSTSSVRHDRPRRAWSALLQMLSRLSKLLPAIMTAGRGDLRRQGANVKVLVFDMGHVFVDFEWDAVCEGFCQAAGVSRERLKEVFSQVAKLGYESGHIDTNTFLQELNTRLGSNIERSQFDQLWVSTFRENEEMAALLQTLKQQRPLYLLSNTNEVHYEYLQGRYDVARHFEELILSYKVGCSKPDASIYREVLRRADVPAHNCLFVDDLEPNILAASELGMQVIQFKGVAHLKDKLSEFGFKV
jgi:glucose-1-phosphatase